MIDRLGDMLMGCPYCDFLETRYSLSRRQFAVARDYLLMGLSVRQIAAKHHCSYFSALEAVIEIRSIIADCSGGDLTSLRIARSFIRLFTNI